MRGNALMYIVLLIGLLSVSFVTGQLLTKKDDPIRVQVKTVNILVSVHDKETGEFVKGLTKEDFKVYEGGRINPITNYVEETNLPLSIALCIDTSSSVRVKMEFEKEAATDFIYSVMRPKDQALLLEFDTAATLLHDFTSNPNDLTREIGRLRAGGGTSLYDAIYLISEQKMTGVQGRKAIVVLSDGADQTSEYQFEDALRASFQAEAAIYAISTTRFGADIDHEGDNALKQLSQNTGGRAYFPYSVAQLSAAFKAINKELRNQYSIAFTPIDGRDDGTFRKIRIKVKRKNSILYYRKGYFASLLVRKE
jgi:Ca-activated chloride channel family protein